MFALLWINFWFHKDFLLIFSNEIIIIGIKFEIMIKKAHWDNFDFEKGINEWNIRNEFVYSMLEIQIKNIESYIIQQLFMSNPQKYIHKFYKRKFQFCSLNNLSEFWVGRFEFYRHNSTLGYWYPRLSNFFTHISSPKNRSQ